MTSPKTKTINSANKRIWEIDFLRGVLIIGMVVDHFMFFLGMFKTLYAPETVPFWLANVGDFADAYWRNEVKIAIRCLGVALFFFLTGISSKFSKSNLKRSLICMTFGVGLSLIFMTYSLIAKANHYSLFGIITCLGVCMLLYWAGKTLYIKAKKSEEGWKWWALGIGVVLSLGGIITNLCISSSLKFGHIFLSALGEFNPGEVSSNEPLTFGKAILSIIGFYRWGNDWCGLLPYLGFTYLGGFIGEHVYEKRTSIFFRKDPEKNIEFNLKATRKTWVINWLGSKTFIIYLLHPIVIVLFMLIVFSIITLSFPTLLFSIKHLLY